MSKSQIRKRGSEMRERIRYGIQAAEFRYGSDFTGRMWLEGAIRLCQEQSREYIRTIQAVEARERDLRRELDQLRKWEREVKIRASELSGIPKAILFSEEGG